MTSVFNTSISGKTKDAFEHDLQFHDLNQDQKYAYLLILTSMFLQIQDITLLLGAAGSGKSEAVKVLYKKYQEWMLIVAPTGILAAG